MMKHHLVQMDPVAIRAKFCVKDNFSGGRRKSVAPARTTPHFMTGALYVKIRNQHDRFLYSWTRQLRRPNTESRLTYQKCTVRMPTSLVHNLCHMLCCTCGALSTAGFVAVPWKRRKMGLRTWKGVRDAKEDVCLVVCCAKRIPKRADILKANRVLGI